MPRTTPDVVAAGTLSEMEQPTITVASGRQLRPWTGDDRDTVPRAFADPDIAHWRLGSSGSMPSCKRWRPRRVGHPRGQITLPIYCSTYQSIKACKRAVRPAAGFVY